MQTPERSYCISDIVKLLIKFGCRSLGVIDHYVLPLDTFLLFSLNWYWFSRYHVGILVHFQWTSALMVMGICVLLAIDIVYLSAFLYSIPFSTEDISKAIPAIDPMDVKPPVGVSDVPAAQFLLEDTTALVLTPSVTTWVKVALHRFHLALDAEPTKPILVLVCTWPAIKQTPIWNFLQ